MQLKKILVSILVAIMMFSLVALVATANDEVAPTKPSIDLVAELDSVTKVGDKLVVSEGETFKYVLKIENNPGIGSLKFSINYDADSIQLVAEEIGSIFTPSDEAGGEEVFIPEGFEVVKTTEGKITLQAYKVNFSETKDNGVLISFTFKVKDNKHGAIGDIVIDEENGFGFITSLDTSETVPANVKNAPSIEVHTYEEKVTPPTCTEPGQITYKCKNCDDQMVFEDTNNPATGHKEPAEFTVVTPATCTTPGSKEKVCANGCGTVLATEEIPVVPHNEPADFTVVTPATCTTPGSKQKVCANGCGTVLATEEIPVVPHKLPETWTQTVAPTVEAVGKEERKCADCDYKETRDIDKLPPPPAAPKFTSAPNNPWIIGSEDVGLEFVTDAAFADFKSVSINGTELIASNYTVTEGSTKVLLKAEYLDTLAEGEYTIKVTSANGSAETTFSVVEETSIAPIIICIVVIVVVGGVVATIVVLKKKELI